MSCPPSRGLNVFDCLSAGLRFQREDLGALHVPKLCPEPRRFAKVLVAGDVVALEDLRRRVPADLLGHRLRHTRAHQRAHAGAAKIVGAEVRKPGRRAGRLNPRIRRPRRRRPGRTLTVRALC
jgi:hypothetical protein